MSTPLSSPAPYARFADLKKYRHWAQIADWVTGATGSSNSRVAEADLADVQTTSGALVHDHLMAASGLVESACFRGQKYSVLNLVDITLMTASELSTFQAVLTAAGVTYTTAYQIAGSSRTLLKRIICCLAIGTLSRFKTRTVGDEKDEQFGFEMLDALSSGQKIFSLVEQAGAGNPDYVEMAPANSEEEDDRISVQANRMFGNRRK